MLANNNFILFKTSITGMKNNFAVFLSFLYLAIVLLVFIKGFQVYSQSELIRSQNRGNPEDFEPLNQTLTMTFPKVYLDYGRWIDLAGRIRAPFNLLKECTNLQFKKYFPGLEKNKDLIYYCLEAYKVPDIILYSVQFEKCSTINNNEKYMRARDPLCESNITDSVIIEWSPYLSAQFHYNYYNETERTLNYINQTISSQKPKNISNMPDNYFSTYIYIYKYQFDEEVFYNSVKSINSTKLEIDYPSHRYDSSFIFGFQMNYYKTINKLEFSNVSFYKSKVPILLSFIVSLLNIIYMIFYRLNTIYTEYLYKRYILDKIFSDMIVEKNINNQNKVLDYDINSNYNLKNYLLSYFTSNHNFDALESIIIETISLEKVISDQPSSKEETKSKITENKKDHFLKKIDLLSNINLVYFKKSDNYKSIIHYIALIILSCFLLFITIGVGLNFFNDNKYVTNFSVSPIIKYKYDPITNVVYDSLARLRLKRSVYESFKLVVLNQNYYLNFTYIKLDHHECSKKELQTIFDINEINSDYIDICLSYKDIFQDFFNNPVLDHEIHLVKCSDNLDLFNENECRNLVSPNEIIDIDFEMQVLNKKRKIVNGTVAFSDNIVDKGYFATYLNLKTTVEDDKILTFFDITSHSFRYQEALNNRRKSIFSIYLKIGINHQINERFKKNILSYINIVLSYFQIFKFIVIIFLSWIFEYNYLKQSIRISPKLELKKEEPEQIDNLENSNTRFVKINNYISNTSVNVLNKEKNFFTVEQNNKHVKFTFNLFLKFKFNLLKDEENKEFNKLLSHIEINNLLKIAKQEEPFKNPQSTLYYSDIFSDYNNYFYYKKNKTIRTYLGGILSFILIIFFIPIIYLTNLDYWNHTNPKIRTSIFTDDLVKYKEKIDNVTEIKNFNLSLTVDSKMKDDFHMIKTIFDIPILLKDNDFSKIDDKFNISSTFYNRIYVIYQHKCLNNSIVTISQDCNLDSIYNYSFSIKYNNYDEDNLENNSPKIFEITKNFTSNANKTPYYHALFNTLLLYDNTGNTFEMEEYKHYVLNTKVIDGMRKNKQWSYNNKEALEIMVHPHLDNEIKIITYKTLSEVIIDSFSVISLMIIIFKSICHYYATYVYIKLLNEDSSILSTTTDLNSICLINYFLDLIRCAPTSYINRKNFLLDKISLNNFN
jgi:hypothetical protein